jgi:hypothetical protein
MVRAEVEAGVKYVLLFCGTDEDARAFAPGSSR